MIKLPDIKNLTPEDGKEKLVQELVKQVQKDFAEFQFEIDDPVNRFNVYYELFSQINLVIRVLMEDDYQRLLSLLYRIDLSETDIKKESRKQPETEISYIITDSIIKRELQKVVIRKHFS